MKASIETISLEEIVTRLARVEKIIADWQAVEHVYESTPEKKDVIEDEARQPDLRFGLVGQVENKEPQRMNRFWMSYHASRTGAYGKCRSASVLASLRFAWQQCQTLGWE